jgi:hypothetical protein
LIKELKKMFRDCEPFDWYQRYGNLKPIISKCIKPNSKILVVGCGTSSMNPAYFVRNYTISSGLSEEMIADNCREIQNIDISHTVIRQMGERHKDIPNLICNETTHEFLF